MQLRSKYQTLVIMAVIGAPSASTYAQSPQAAQPTVAVQYAGAAAAAKQDLAHFVQHNMQRGGTALPEGFPLDVANLAALKSVRIAYGFPMYTVEPTRITAGETDLSAMATPTGSWRFLIYQGNKPAGLATVEMVDGQWKTVAYGAMALSQDVDTLMKLHGNADRSNLRFIRIYQAQADLLEVAGTKGSPARFALLPSAQRAILPADARQKELASTTGNSLKAASDFIEPLRQAIGTSLRQ